MPCRDDWPYDARRTVTNDELNLLNDYEAAFCAVMTVLEEDGELFNTVLKLIDYKEAGVTKRRFLEIWEIHKEKDALRKAREQAEEEKARKTAEIAAKLAKTFTHEDLKILKEVINGR